MHLFMGWIHLKIFLSSKKEITDADRLTYFAKSGGWWVTGVTDRYKLVLDKKEKPYLFDLKKDPDELINFYNDAAYKSIKDKMQKELIAQLKEYKEPGLKKTNGSSYILK